MKLIIGGAGRVGLHLLDFLAKEGNDIIVIDSDPERIRHINEKYDVQGYVGHTGDPEVLAEVGASSDIDIMIAVAHSDEVNILAAQVARTVFNVQTSIVRIRRPSYLGSHFLPLIDQGVIPIDHIISPEMETADAIRKSLEISGAAEASPLCDGVVELISLHLHADCSILNTPLRALTDRFSDLPITIMAIVRGERILVPRASECFEVDDLVYFCVDHKYITKGLETFGYEVKPLERVMIAGGGQIAANLCEKLLRDFSDIKIRVIEKSPARARELSNLMKGKITVVRGDSMELDILEEAGIERADAVLTVTDNEEINILLALLAKRKGVERVGALVNRSDYFPMLNALGIDMVISPRDVTASMIMRYLRSGQVLQVLSIAAGQAEVIESLITANSPICDQTIQEAHFPKQALVGAIVRDGKMLVPRPNMTIQAEDRMVILAERSMVDRVQDKLTPIAL